MLALLCALAAPAVLLAQDNPKDSEKKGMEVFDEVDPYTKGDKELVKKLGYVRVGHGPWHGVDDTHALQETMGGIEMLFCETEHFRIATSLTTYTVPNNREEREKLDGEFKRLKKKLGRFKPPKNELDPWLRLHLYAQRVEDQYAQFLEEWNIDPQEFEQRGPYLGYPNKIQVLVCQRKSEFGRYVRAYHQTDLEYSYRTVRPGDSIVVGANMEALKEGWEGHQDLPFDSMLHNMVVSSLASDFIDAWNDNMFSAPRWLSYGLAHVHLRRIDPHWTLFDGRKAGQGNDPDQWDWEPRVYSLVKNEFFAKAEEMFAWKEYADLHQRDHMISWSKVEFVLDQLGDGKRAFLDAACGARGGFSTQAQDTGALERQRAAFKTAFDMTPEEFDAAWAKWVLKTYRKK
ncbi:MAG: hypothetical protein H6828_07150 [Planctomycetes bacterium]|nr:hypothetical protein [Planctomycetota bacterium]